MGYRYYEKNRIPVQFCFGHGLSYTDFTYDNLKIEEIPSKARANGFDVQLQVRNVGALEGKRDGSVVSWREDGFSGKFLRKPGEGTEGI